MSDPMKTCRGACAALLFAASAAVAQSGNAECSSSDSAIAGAAVMTAHCLEATAGFSGETGSYAAASAAATGHFGLGETARIGAQYGLRLRRLQLDLSRRFLPGKQLEAGVTFYGQRFNYNESRDASILAFSRDVPQYADFAPDDLLRYSTRSYGATVFAKLALPGGVSHVGLAYTYDVTGATPDAPATADYFAGLNFLGPGGRNRLSGIDRGKVTASFSRDTRNRKDQPSAGMTISAAVAVAGLGGAVNTVEPAVDLRWYHRGVWKRHVIAARLRGRMLMGYGGSAAPPYERYYLGGEDEVRGFSSWSVSPIAYVPGAATIPVLNDDGTSRTQTIFVNGVPTVAGVTMTIPVYRPISVGGDTKAIANLEYRIPLFGPFTAVLFTDAGVDRSTFSRQFQLNAGYVNDLNAGVNSAGFARDLRFQPGSQGYRMSSGVELRAVVPKVNIPIRFYWAYNPLACGNPGTALISYMPACNYFQAPFAGSRSMFPNFATFSSAGATYDRGTLYQEPRSVFRAAVGLTF